MRPTQITIPRINILGRHQHHRRHNRKQIGHTMQYRLHLFGKYRIGHFVFHRTQKGHGERRGVEWHTDATQLEEESLDLTRVHVAHPQEVVVIVVAVGRLGEDWGQEGDALDETVGGHSANDATVGAG